MRKLKLWNSDKTLSKNLNSNNYLVSDISGLGSNFNFKKIQNTIYDFEYEFDPISLTINFGINGNAYTDYKSFIDFIAANGKNKLILEYDYNGTPRFCDVFLQAAPKSQKNNFNIISEKFTFIRTTLWYQIIESIVNNFQVINDTNEKYPVYFTMRENTNESSVFVKTEQGTIVSEVQLLPFGDDEIIIDSENKMVKRISYSLMKELNGYDLIKKTKDTFIYVPPGTHILSITNMTHMGFEWKIKRWIND